MRHQSGWRFTESWSRVARPARGPPLQQGVGRHVGSARMLQDWAAGHGKATTGDEQAAGTHAAEGTGRHPHAPPARTHSRLCAGGSWFISNASSRLSRSGSFSRAGERGAWPLRSRSPPPRRGEAERWRRGEGERWRRGEGERWRRGSRSRRLSWSRKRSPLCSRRERGREGGSSLGGWGAQGREPQVWGDTGSREQLILRQAAGRRGGAGRRWRQPPPFSPPALAPDPAAARSTASARLSQATAPAARDTREDRHIRAALPAHEAGCSCTAPLPACPALPPPHFEHTIPSPSLPPAPALCI